MTIIVLSALYLLLFIVSYKKSELGISFLLFLHCTIDTSLLDLPMPGMGTFAAADFVIFGLLMNLATHKSTYKSSTKTLITLIIAWLLIAGTFFYASDAFNFKKLYNYLFRYSSIWAIIFFIYDYTESQRKLLIKSIFASVSVVMLAQYYAYATLDFDFIRTFYYQFRETGVYDLMGWGAEQQLVNQQSSMGLPRLYPSGTALCMATFAYVLANLFLGNFKSKYEKYFNIIYLLLLFGFLVSLRGRAPIFGLSFILIFLITKIYFLSTARVSSNSRKRVAVSFIVLLVFVASSFLILDFSSNVMISSLLDRIKEFDIEFYFDPKKSNRASDNLLALELLSEHLLFGIGSPSIPLNYPGLVRAGFDLHPLLSLAMYGGMPVLIFTLLFIATILRSVIRRSNAFHFQRVMPYGISVLYLVAMIALNSLQVFSSAMQIIPFLVFSGLYESANRSKKFNRVLTY